MESVAYYDARPNFRPGDLLGWQGAAGISAPIAFLTGSRTTHISMLLGEIQASELRWLIMEAYEGGHGIASGCVNDNYLSDKLRGYQGRCVWYPLNPELEAYRDPICRILWDQKGKPYDYWTLFGNALGRRDLDPEAFICSELAQYALRQGIPRQVLANYPMSEEMELLFECEIAMVPGDFERLPIFDFINRKHIYL